MVGAAGATLRVAGTGQQQRGLAVSKESEHLAVRRIQKMRIDFYAHDAADPAARKIYLGATQPWIRILAKVLRQTNVSLLHINPRMLPRHSSG